MKNKPLCAPDPVRLAKVQELCTIENPYVEPNRYDELFTEAMQESLRWHQSGCKMYRNLLAQNDFHPETWNGKLAELPFIVADFFKLHEVKSIAPEQVSLHLTSSGTTGQKSQMFFDDWSIGCAQQMIDFIFQHYSWIDQTPTNYLLYSYETEEGSRLGTAYTDNFLTKYSPIKSVFYALRWNGQSGHDFDLYGCIRALEEYAEAGLPVRIFGFPAFFYFTLQRMSLLKKPHLKLNEKSLVFLGGGWKGHANQAIEKSQLYQMIETQLGIPGARLRDGFGSVEHCVPYVECEFHHFHIPLYSRVLIRDFKTLEPLDYGQKGFLQFVSPYITSVPAHSVLMGDMAVLHPASACPCGLAADWFEILGRAGVAKNKSCAIAAAELLKGFA